MQLAGNDAERDKDEQDVHVVAGQRAPDHGPDILGVGLPLRIVVATGTQQRGGLAERAIRGRRHGTGSIVEAFVATVTVELGS